MESQSSLSDTSLEDRRAKITCPQCGCPLEHDFLEKQGWIRETSVVKTPNQQIVMLPGPLTMEMDAFSKERVEELLKENSSLKDRSLQLYSEVRNQKGARLDAEKERDAFKAANIRVEEKLGELVESIEVDVAEKTISSHSVAFILDFIERELKFSDE